jgi:hypothetical protein
MKQWNVVAVWMTLSLWAGIAPAAEPVGLITNISQTAVDLRDIAKFKPELFPEARVIIDSMKSEPSRYFPDDIAMVHGVELMEAPVRDDKSVTAKAIALTQSPHDGLVFRKYEISVASDSVQSVKQTDVIPVSKTHFQLKVGLVQRKLVLEEPEYQIKKIYPIGVGGFDEGVSPESKGQVRLTTPIFESAKLEQRHAIEARTEPAYYKGLPFLPITNRNGRRTTIAFHILMEDPMRRGFESHGCMRLRKKDLMELYLLLMNEANDNMPVQVLYTLPDASDSPYPLNEIGYMRFKNFGDLQHPETRRDPEHHLVIMERNRQDPPPYRLIPELNLDALFLEQATADLQ